MKKLLSLIILTCMLTAAFSGITLFEASAETSGKCGANLTWTLDDSGNLSISGSGAMNDYDSCGPWEHGVKKVVICNGVTSIGSYAFDSCTGLTSITIPNSVTSIGDNAFKNSAGLTSIEIPSSVTSIGEYAFWNCAKLTSITIPSSVTSIGDCAFSCCSGLETITVESGNQKYRSIDNCLIDIKSNTLILGCKNSKIPSSVTSIGTNAFENCIGLTSIAIPCSVTSISHFAFYNCTDLASIAIPCSITSIGAYAFADCSELKDVYYSGPERMWSDISIGTGNNYLKNANIRYDCCKHEYDNACDDTCNECGYHREVPDHDYDEDGICVHCGFVGEKIDIRIETVETAFGGKNIAVKVFAQYDPSWSSIGFDIKFDASKLKYKSFKFNPAIVEQIGNGELNIILMNTDNAESGNVIVTFASAVKVNGVEGYHPIDSDGNAYEYLGTLIFDAADGFDGFADITATVTNIGCVRDGKIRNIGVKVENGGINVLRNMPGDPDGDGEITVTDALAALRVAAKLAEPTPELLATCDIDNDGEITVTDALAILRVAAKLADSL